METGLNSCFIVRFEFHNKFELKNSEFKINVGNVALKECCFYANERKKNQNVIGKKKSNE